MSAPRIYSVTMKLLFTFGIVAAALRVSVLSVEQPMASTMSARELARQMDATMQGSALIRTQLAVRFLDGGKRVMQLQIKQRRTETATDLAYRVLWPNDRRDEVVILHQDTGSAPQGSVIIPRQPVRTIGASQMDEGLFDSDLSYQDAIENIYGWKEQAIVGSEAINGVTCQVLESKPGNSSVSMYAKARSWIDPRRLVPLRIEKYSHSGELIRRIEITRIARDEKHNPIPAGLTVHGLRKNTVTEFNGARIDQGVTFTDDDFKPGGVLH
jgi:hypothetical protein